MAFELGHDANRPVIETIHGPTPYANLSEKERKELERTRAELNAQVTSQKLRAS